MKVMLISRALHFYMDITRILNPWQGGSTRVARLRGDAPFLGTIGNYPNRT
jgi:hypothetical protein